jgi:hypothetical protein
MPLSRAVWLKTLLVARVWWVAANLVVACGGEGRDLPPPATRPVQAAASSDEIVPGTCVEGPASWERVDALLARSCRSCHSQALSGDARLGAPVGIDFDRAPAVRRHAERILARAVVDGTMPPGGVLPDCSRALLDEYLQGSLAAECTPDCESRACGDDGCGGECGACAEDQLCNLAGACLDAICTPSCDHRSCGDDGCGGSCGDCSPGTQCGDGGGCECAPSCDDRSCGDDGCGGSCGSCADNELCSSGTCTCMPDCGDHECGDNGCGGSCGRCSTPKVCDGSQQCSCTPDCEGRSCGLDGCGGSCGECEGIQVCNTNEGQCQDTCQGDCTGKICGDDGCSVSCGACDSGLTCEDGVSCVCVPACAGKQCGDDGCGHECGSCDDGLDCTSEGHCECVPDCSGRECGDDGCGHECGAECDAGSYCDAGGQCACIPTCAPGSCGDDGCGSPCACEQGQTCDAELCAWPDVSFVGDVYPLFVGTCNGSGCHSTTSGTPKAMLDLLGSETAHGELVGVASVNCTVTPKTLVVANDVAASYLINKLTGVGLCGGQPMPRSAPMSGLPNPPALSESQIDLVRAWIATGALDD